MAVRVGALADKALAVAPALVLAMSAAKKPVKVSDYLADRPWLVALLLLAAAALAQFPPFALAARAGEDERRRASQQKCQQTLLELIEHGLARDPGFDLTDPGVHLWKIRRTLLNPGGRMSRTATFRLGVGSGLNRPFTPKKGQGVVGLCWKAGFAQDVDAGALAARLTDKVSFDAHATQEGKEAVMGLSWEQFEQVKHRGLVAAAPVRGRARLKGCVSVDLASGDTNDLALLRDEAVKLAEALAPSDLAPS